MRFVWVFAAVAFLMAGSSQAQELRIGAGAAKITPPVGIGMAGYYFERGAEGTHDDLFAKCIVIEQSGQRVALIALDLISTTRPMVEAARREIEKRTGIPAEHLMISATHAHTGPVLPNRGNRELVQGGETGLVTSYANGLPALIADAIEQAVSKLEPARALAAVEREEHLSFNRRYFMNDDTVGWNPGKLNPKIVKPAGPIDPDVGVVLFESPAAKPPAKAIATYVNFAMHPDTTGGQFFSADYPGVLANRLSAYKGEQMLTLFANGPCGNVNHVDVNWADPQHGYTEAARIGTILAADVLRAYREIQPVKGGELRVLSRMVQLPTPKVTDEEVASAAATAKELGMKDNRGFMQKVRAYRILDIAARKGQPLEVEVQVVALGDELVWVSMPGELFVQLGLAIKKASPFKYTMIAELANGAIGYIPDRKAFAEGNYEPESARCAPGAGEMLVETASKMLEEIKNHR